MLEMDNFRSFACELIRGSWLDHGWAPWPNIGEGTRASRAP